LGADFVGVSFFDRIHRINRMENYQRGLFCSALPSCKSC
jgi:hypothetical protein